MSRKTWQSFTQESSMHGIRYVMDKKVPMARRLLWGVVILSLLGYFLYATTLFLTDFTRKTVSTTLKVEKADNLTFPTVTICNRNIWKRSAVSEIFDDSPESSDLMLEILSDLYIGHKLPPPDGKYNWSDPFFQFSEAANFSHGAHGIGSFLAHSLDETFLNCFINFKNMSCPTVLTDVKTDAGICYQFNRDGSFNSRTAGRSGGISFTLDAKVHEYFMGPYSYSEGFFVALHSFDEVPLMEELAYSVGVGMETYLIIRRKQVKRKPPPADGNKADCFDTTELPNPLRLHKKYSQSACLDECKTMFVLERCGCREEMMTEVEGSVICSARQMLTCSTLATREFSTQRDYIDTCDCRVKCNEIEYGVKYSTSGFPSSNFQRELNLSESYLRYQKENYVLLRIAYERMATEVVEEKVTYDGSDFIANIGGTLGLCVGASVLTTVEFIEFFILQLTYFISARKKQKKTTPVKVFA